MKYSYKDSGIEWLGKVPEHWKREKLFRLCRNIGSGGTPTSTNESYYGGDIPWVQSGDLNDGVLHETSKTLTEDGLKNSAAKVYDSGTLLVAMYGASIGKLGITAMAAATNQACCAIEPLAKLNQRYLYYLILEVRDYLVFEAYGGTQPNISQEIVKQLYFHLPPTEEQAAIAAHLDNACAKLDRVIAIKEEQLMRLKGHLSAVIHAVVTRGLKSTKLVDSGIDWLGPIPKHWTMTRLASLGTFHKGRGITKSELIDDPDGVPTILYGDIYTKYDYSTSALLNRVNDATAEKVFELKQGDLVMTGSGESFEEIGKCVHYTGDERAVAGGDTIIFRTRKDNPAYLSYVLNSPISVRQKASTAKGDIVAHTYPSELRNIVFPLPPREEQDAIVEYLDRVRTNLDRMTGQRQDLSASIIRTQIATLQAYRKSFIHECVTGKKQVFGVTSIANKEAVA